MDNLGLINRRRKSNLLSDDKRYYRLTASSADGRRFFRISSHPFIVQEFFSCQNRRCTENLDQSIFFCFGRAPNFPTFQRYAANGSLASQGEKCYCSRHFTRVLRCRESESARVLAVKKELSRPRESSLHV
jgi:hypothetical protein